MNTLYNDLVNIYRDNEKKISVYMNKKSNRYFVPYLGKNEILVNDELEFKGNKYKVKRVFNDFKELVIVV